LNKSDVARCGTATGVCHFQPHPSSSRSQKWQLIGFCSPSAANDIDQDGNDCEYQKYVDETAQGVGS
jgi:hypothetical protein